MQQKKPAAPLSGSLLCTRPGTAAAQCTRSRCGLQRLRGAVQVRHRLFLSLSSCPSGPRTTLDRMQVSTRMLSSAKPAAGSARLAQRSACTARPARFVAGSRRVAPVRAVELVDGIPAALEAAGAAEALPLVVSGLGAEAGIIAGGAVLGAWPDGRGCRDGRFRVRQVRAEAMGGCPRSRSTFCQPAILPSPWCCLVLLPADARPAAWGARPLPGRAVGKSKSGSPEPAEAACTPEW